MLTMFVYALGAAGALIAVGFGLGRLTGSARARALSAGSRGRFALGFSLAVFGALTLTGLDHRVEAALVDAMPDWLAGAAGAL
jgi:cytochrome c biogenesis protein CcdA